MKRVTKTMGSELEEGSNVQLDWSKLEKVASKKCDVVPVVVQDSSTGSVLIAAYVNERALAETFKQQVVCLWSTSRNELWVKGKTSGDTLDLDEVRINCEQNSLLFRCTPRRKGACHTKDAAGETRVSCYYRRVVPASDGTLVLDHADDAPRTGSSGISLVTASMLTAAAAIAASLATIALLRKR